jgi:hypothetical protein
VFRRIGVQVLSEQELVKLNADLNENVWRVRIYVQENGAARAVHTAIFSFFSARCARGRVFSLIIIIM